MEEGGLALTPHVSQTLFGLVWQPHPGNLNTKATKQNNWQGKQSQSEMPRSFQLLSSNKASWNPGINRTRSQGHRKLSTWHPTDSVWNLGSLLSSMEEPWWYFWPHLRWCCLHSQPWGPQHSRFIGGKLWMFLQLSGFKKGALLYFGKMGALPALL